MFNKAWKYSASFKRLNVSNEKVEKVVNPPQIPIVKNNLSDGEIRNFSSK